jgi:hypothetical protein
MPERPHLSYPVKLLPSGRLLTNEQDSDAEVADCIAVVLSWPVGTRQGEPDFGVPGQLFGSGGPDLSEIRNAVTANEPRAAGVRDEVIEAALRRGVATVRVGFDQVGGEAG